MSSLVEALKETMVQVRDLLSPGAESRSELIYHRACRILVRGPEDAEKYRATILVRSRSFVEAEAEAESQLQEWIDEQQLHRRGEVTVRWLKGRPLSRRPREEESATVLQLLARLRRESGNAVLAVEPVKVPSTV